jgi:hypothetical protein
MLLNSTGCSAIETLLGGTCTAVMDGKSILKPERKPSGILANRSRMPAWRSSYSQASALYGVSGSSLLCTRALLGPMMSCSTAGADVECIVSGGGTAFLSLPGRAYLLSVFGPECFANALCKGFMLLIPCLGGRAINCAVRVVPEANCTAREGS